MTINLLILIHGITTEERPGSHAATYAAFWSAMQESQPRLREHIAKVVHVEWGNAFADGPQTPDTKMSDAERNVAQLVRYEHVAAHADPASNVVMRGLDQDFNPLALRWALRRIREQLVQFGLADAVYYASEEGEFDVRNNVYSQILSALREYLDAPDVRLHLVTHSLGVTVGHDFLYGLFGSTSPDFLDQARDPQDAADYLTWRRKVGDGELRVGSLTTMASQLPLFGLRKRSLVQRLAAGQTLQTGDIGIGLDDKVRWLVVYDVDDVLGFATRELYGNHPSIRQVQVDSGDDPITAHVGYWREPQTIHEAADLIAKRAAE